MKKKFQFVCRNCNHKQIVELKIRPNIENYQITCKKCGNQRFFRILHPPETSSRIHKVSPLKEKIYESLETFMNLKILIVFIVAVFIFFFVLISGGLIISFLRFSPEVYLKDLTTPQTNLILDKEGRLIAELFEQKYSNLKYKEIPEEMIQILLSVEDENFFSHGGIDYFAVLRATFVNLSSFRIKQGASTITQQLARILLNRREKTFARKFNEALLAYYLESKFTKEEILTYYMNLVYLGHGAYGFQNASQFYFQKDLDDLNFTEKLALACLPSRPEFYSPLRNYEYLEKKMDFVFQRVKKSHKFKIDSQTYEKQKQILRQKLNRSPYESVFGTKLDYAPYVTDYIRTKLTEILGKEFVHSGGFKIYTTIDRGLQQVVASETLSHIKELRKYHKYKKNQNEKVKLKKYYLNLALGGIFFGFPVPSIMNFELESASIGIRPRTGEILFMQGGSEFLPNNQFNRAINMYRQTGSAIKPIIYSAGIEDGIFSPATIFEDSPIYYPLKQKDREYWLPENIDLAFEGNISLREALEKSRNIPALQATQKLGIDRIGNQFAKFFFHTSRSYERRFKKEIAVGIGILEMSPLEMALAYSVFANNGILMRPFLIQKIEDNRGEIIYIHSNKDEFNTNIPDNYVVLRGDVCEVMISLLKSSIKFSGVKRGGFYSERLAGKTGTTNQYKDAWFIGILPELVMSIWIGFDDPSAVMNKATGAAVSGPLYGKILKNIKEYDTGDYHFEPRAKILQFCPRTGKIPSPQCPTHIEEIVPESFNQHQICDFHNRRIQEKTPSDFE